MKFMFDAVEMSLMNLQEKLIKGKNIHMNNFKNNIINFILGYNKELDESIKYKIVYAPAVCLKKTGDLIDLYVINLNDV